MPKDAVLFFGVAAARIPRGRMEPKGAHRMRKKRSGTRENRGARRAVSALLTLCLALTLLAGVGLAPPARADATINLSALVYGTPIPDTGDGWNYDGSNTLTITAPGVYTLTGGLDAAGYLAASGGKGLQIIIDEAVNTSVTLDGGTPGFDGNGLYITDKRVNPKLTLRDLQITSPQNAGVNSLTFPMTGGSDVELQILGTVSFRGPATTGLSQVFGIVSLIHGRITLKGDGTLFVQGRGGESTAANKGGIALLTNALTIDGPDVTLVASDPGLANGVGPGVYQPALSCDRLDVSAGSLTVQGLSGAPVAGATHARLVEVRSFPLTVHSGARMVVNGHLGNVDVVYVKSDAVVDGGSLSVAADLAAGADARLVNCDTGSLVIRNGGSVALSGGIGAGPLLRAATISQKGLLSAEVRRGVAFALVGAGLHYMDTNTSELWVTNHGSAFHADVRKTIPDAWYFNPPAANPNPSPIAAPVDDDQTFTFPGGGVTTIVRFASFTPPTIGGVATLTDGVTLPFGYAAPYQKQYAAAGSPAPTLRVTGDPGHSGATITQAGLLEIPTGLAPGVYPIVVTAANTVMPDATLTFTLTVDPGQPVMTTLTDPATGVSVTGGMYAGTALRVSTANVLHPPGCPACDHIRGLRDQGGVLTLLDIALQPPVGANLNYAVVIPVPSGHNGQTLGIIHCNNGVQEMSSSTVTGDTVRTGVNSFSPFAVLKPSDSAPGDVPPTGDTSPWAALTGLTAALALCYLLLLRMGREAGPKRG